MLSLSTSRLHLMLQTREHAEAEVNNRARLSQLHTSFHDGWTTPLNDDASMQLTLNYLHENLTPAVGRCGTSSCRVTLMVNLLSSATATMIRVPAADSMYIPRTKSAGSRSTPLLMRIEC